MRYFLQQTNSTTYHKSLFALAIPMILSNITVPLLGLVDTAVIGHLEHAYYLGGSTVGAMIITFITWLCGFLRMSTTGMTAQAYGRRDDIGNLFCLTRGLLVAVTLGFVFILLQAWYLDFSLWLAGGSEQVQFYARRYSEIRIWGLPAALANLVIVGWLLGNHQAKTVMWLLVMTNLLNLLFDLWFVLGLGLNVEGVAYATLIAEYSGLLIGLWLIFSRQKNWWLLLKNKLLFNWPSLLAGHAMKQYFSLNRDILIRTLCLEVCFVFITFQGARLGDDVVAANAILMNFLLLISLGLDGIANAAEVLVGEAKGSNNPNKLKSIVRISLFWTGVFAVVYALFFTLFGDWLIRLITSIPEVINLAEDYIVWLWLMPLLACWCYLYDGIYIGLMQAKTMRNSMIISTFVGFFPLWYLLQGLGNHAIWAAFSMFMILRGVTLAWHFHTVVAKES